MRYDRIIFEKSCYFFKNPGLFSYIVRVCEIIQHVIILYNFDVVTMSDV